MINDIYRMEKKIHDYERAKMINEKNESISIILDFNSYGESNFDNIYLLCTVPPKKEWIIKAR